MHPTTDDKTQVLPIEAQDAPRWWGLALRFFFWLAAYLALALAVMGALSLSA